MNVAAPTARAVSPGAEDEGPRAATGRVILSLARVEGRRLLRHPIFVVGVALSVIGTLIQGVEAWGRPPSVVEPIWPIGFPIGPLAVFGFVAMNLAAMRDRLTGAEETFRAAPLPHRARTAALLVSAAWAVAAGLVLLTPFVARFALVYRVSLADIVKLVEEPLIVAVVALAGTALGRLAPSRLVGAVAAFFIFMAMGAYAHPVVAYQSLGLWVIPDSLPSVGWHILYLVGLGSCAATLALMKDGVRRSLVAASAIGVAAVAVGAILQLPVSCSGAGVPCVFP